MFAHSTEGLAPMCMQNKLLLISQLSLAFSAEFGGTIQLLFALMYPSTISQSTGAHLFEQRETHNDPNDYRQPTCN